MMLNNLHPSFLKELTHQTVGLAASTVNTATGWGREYCLYVKGRECESGKCKPVNLIGVKWEEDSINLPKMHRTSGLRRFALFCSVVFLKEN